jgi:hypothetical protein
VSQTKNQTRRQTVQDARDAALQGNWDVALQLNQQIIDRYPRDAEAYNRLGRALLALRRTGPATEAYSGALRADPANMIARRNLQRLETLRHRSSDGSETEAVASEDIAAPTTLNTTVFVEEVGKTWVDELVNPAPIDELAQVLSSDQILLEVEGRRLVVKRNDGLRLGEIEAKTAERVIAMIEAGNRYEAYALGLSTQSLRVILREVYRDPSQATTVSFPRQITSRAYLRERDLLRQRDEADFFLLDDDDEEEEAVASDSDDDEPAEPDADTFTEEPVGLEEEEQTV